MIIIASWGCCKAYFVNVYAMQCNAMPIGTYYGSTVLHFHAISSVRSFCNIFRGCSTKKSEWLHIPESVNMLAENKNDVLR